MAAFVEIGAAGIQHLGDERAHMLAQEQGHNRVKLMVRSGKWLRRNFIRSTRLLNLNDVSYASWMSYLSNAAVMGILTLNIYSASYFLAWRKEGSFCHVFPESANAPAPANFADAVSDDKTITTVIRLAVVSIPFLGLPLTICIGALAKASRETVQLLLL